MLLKMQSWAKKKYLAPLPGITRTQTIAPSNVLEQTISNSLIDVVDVM